jgi:hypothetical protein
MNERDIFKKEKSTEVKKNKTKITTTKQNNLINKN